MSYSRAMGEILQDEVRLSEGLKEMGEGLIREGNLRFLDSPEEEIYAFATPLLVLEHRHRDICRWILRIMRCLDEIGQWLRSHPSEARDHMIFRSPWDEVFFRMGPGFEAMAPIYRVDLVLHEEGPPQLMEINCGCPGGELDPALVAHAFMSSCLAPHLCEALAADDVLPKSIIYQDPRDDSLNHLLNTYRSFCISHPSFPERPTIGLITSSAQANFMIPECRGIAQHYRSRGYRTLVGDLLELVCTGDEVLLRGEPLHLIFRKFSTVSFRLRMERPERFGEKVTRKVRGIWEALADGRVCMVNPLGSTGLQDKGLLGMLWERCPGLRSVIPQTHILGPELPTEDPPLWEEIRDGEPFILKRRLSFDGRHVILNPKEVKERAPMILHEAPGDWVAQRRLPAPRYPFGVLTQGEIRGGDFPYNVSCFGESLFVRVGLGGPYDPVNAHRGGAATCAFVV